MNIPRVDAELSDREAIRSLCRAAQEDWLAKRFGNPAAPLWKEQFLLWGYDPQTGKAAHFTWDQCIGNGDKILAEVGDVAPHPNKPCFEIQGLIAVVRLPLAQCGSGGKLHPIDNLVINIRRNGSWTGVAAVAGDWKLTARDRFDPKDENHRKLQDYYDRLERIELAKDVSGVREMIDPAFRGIMPSRLQDGVELIDREATLAVLSESMKASSCPKHNHRILYAKVIGPLALVVSETSVTLDRQPEQNWRCIALFCSEGDRWKTCLAVHGDWEKVLTAEPGSEFWADAAESGRKEAAPSDAKASGVLVDKTSDSPQDMVE